MEEEKSTLATSFLDVLCCGLGAAILLFLVFSVLPHQGVTQSSGQRDLVAGSAAEVRELGVMIDDKEEVKSLNSIVLLKFSVTQTENKDLTAEELSRSVEVEGISPNLKVKNTSPDALIAKDVFEVTDQSRPEIKLVCMRIAIPGGQAKGRKIRITLKRNSPMPLPLIGSCHLIVGNYELAPKDEKAFNKTSKLPECRLVISFLPEAGEKPVSE